MWIESRPPEGGRQVIVRARLDGSGRRDVFGEGYSARTRVHEYGGGAYAAVRDGVVFSNDADGRAYFVNDGAEPRPLTPEPKRPRSLRYADFAPAADGRVLCVRESHESEGEPVNEIVAIDLDGEAPPTVVASWHDFYAAPRPSPDGQRIAYLSWDHPRMPWNGTELWVADAHGGRPERVAGGETEAIVQPAWSAEEQLHWISDRSGWWNLYREGQPLHPAEAEFGTPLWVFGLSTYAFLDDGGIAAMWTSRGLPHIGVLDPRSGALTELEPSLSPDTYTARLRSNGKQIVYIGVSPTEAPAVVVLDPASVVADVVARSTTDQPDPSYISVPRAIEYESEGRTAHALYYAPRNPDFEGPAGTRPPLLVISHGGPTSQADTGLDLTVQFWTSRGIAVVDVNYAGSTGYGREYRDLLHQQWGVVDLEDCENAARHLAEQGEVDPTRLAIRGSSAGGYTTLCALVFSDAFHVGASYYGIADLEGFASETHKFESRYDEWLVPMDKRHERSPINFVDQIVAPVIVFQGLDDPVVTPSQAELIVSALAERGTVHEYHAYEGEAHGFRKAETIVHSLRSELEFYGRVLGFEPAADE